MNAAVSTLLVDAHRHLSFSPVVRGARCAARRTDWESFAEMPPGAFAFYGVHPWHVEDVELDAVCADLAAVLAANPEAGVGEIGLDRLHSRVTGPRQNAFFHGQLEIAARFNRPVALHGAKCWGEVVKHCRPFAGKIPAFLFHGFSRSDGLLPDIAALNGFISVGPAVLNDHAVNYRALVARIPADRILVETDAEDDATAASLPAVYAQTAELRGLSCAAFATTVAANFDRFVSALCHDAR